MRHDYTFRLDSPSASTLASAEALAHQLMVQGHIKTVSIQSGPFGMGWLIRFGDATPLAIKQMQDHLSLEAPGMPSRKTLPGDGTFTIPEGATWRRVPGKASVEITTPSGITVTKPGEWTEYDDLRPMKPEPRKCECGSTAAGSPRHSTWCPLFEDDKRSDGEDEPWGTD